MYPMRKVGEKANLTRMFYAACIYLLIETVIYSLQ